ncbi:MAG: class I SAM-dependent methyltransferase [Candidatus Pacebacteria bacterium]|nr:class I SAM-dependent methyltransferase [Candidatus Paceibacterota bacterium]MCF7862804.1 class I SAM-dependent methyltransferase [Candidatus Paceibacterota bacterium]
MEELLNKKIQEVSLENQIFNQYLVDLKLTTQDLDKVILDVGAGDARFAKYAKDKGVSSSIYSLEPNQKMVVVEKALIGHAEEIPMQDNFFDLIISNSAIPNIYIGDKNVYEKVYKSFSEMLRVLKNGGEIRLARVLVGDKYENQKILANSVNKVLNELKERYNIEVKKMHISINDVYENENNKKKALLAESFLIILKKPNKKSI